ncbi:hypothetical protein K431DRAFT_291965 [Polychaeton citri CBS 116435]|uniref:Uncharacterized protein n=1 Tax=Polychaeton citri CBS 116435 TaxID=1314669 RepID=A0A9P4QDU9_9PEZI|nr:hypothetical protein K431DRAFT_291965 [Polychaeton citri CBS 116435]
MKGLSSCWDIFKFLLILVYFGIYTCICSVPFLFREQKPSCPWPGCPQRQRPTSFQLIDPYSRTTIFPHATRKQEPSRTGFFDLPRELRDDIYSYFLLLGEVTIGPVVVGETGQSHWHPYETDSRRLYSFRSPKVRLKLLTLCRQAHDETSQMLYGENKFTIKIEICSNGRLPSHALSSQLERQAHLLPFASQYANLTKDVMFTPVRHYNSPMRNKAFADLMLQRLNGVSGAYLAVRRAGREYDAEGRGRLVVRAGWRVIARMGGKMPRDLHRWQNSGLVEFSNLFPIDYTITMDDGQSAVVHAYIRESMDKEHFTTADYLPPPKNLFEALNKNAVEIAWADISRSSASYYIPSKYAIKIPKTVRSIVPISHGWYLPKGMRSQGFDAKQMALDWQESLAISAAAIEQDEQARAMSRRGNLYYIG